jgi:hypothetical protein
MKKPKKPHIGAQEKASEERRRHIDVQPSKGEDFWDLRMRIFLSPLSLLSDKINAFLDAEASMMLLGCPGLVYSLSNA